MAQVVVVEDEQVVREVFATWLEGDRHTVRSADCTEATEAILREGLVDVLLIDIRLAEATSGMDVLAWVRQFDPTVAVVMVTGAPAVETAIDALRLNAFDYLVKPVPEAVLLQAVRRAAAHSQLMREKLQLELENQRYRRHLEELIAQRTLVLKRRTQQLLLLNQVSTEISAQQNLSHLYSHLVNAVHGSLGYPTASFYRVDSHRQRLVLEATAGRSDSRLAPGYAQPLSDGLLGLAVREGRIIVANDVSEWPQFVPCASDETRSEAVFPVIVNDDLAFVLDVSDSTVDGFDDIDIVVLQTLVDHLAVALANAKLYDQLRQALRTREHILQNVSHELRTPLTLISGYAEFLVENLPEDVPAVVPGLAQTLIEQTQHLGHLVNQLIMFQTLERENMALDLLDMSAWLENIVDVWQPILERSGLVLVHEIQPGLGHVLGNWNYLTQVMQNLLDNSRKFSPQQGTVLVRAWRQNGEIYTSIRDQGIGVAADKLPHLFDRFYQADSGVTRRFGGMGLGLTIVREIIHQHRGHIVAETDGEGKGMIITFALPAAR